tara:strand:+ start:235 stop:459 length:225 start_codon:yes stop_codon:yes gene_type:complete
MTTKEYKYPQDDEHDIYGNKLAWRRGSELDGSGKKKLRCIACGSSNTDMVKTYANKPYRKSADQRKCWDCGFQS